MDLNIHLTDTLRNLTSHQMVKSKVGCVFPMVIVSILLHAEFGWNNHREDAPSLCWWRVGESFCHQPVVNKKLFRRNRNGSKFPFLHIFLFYPIRWYSTRWKRTPSGSWIMTHDKSPVLLYLKSLNYWAGFQFRWLKIGRD